MGLEVATYINGLNPLNPVGAVDPKSQGDDHLRLIKSTLQASFPNISGAMTVTHTQLNSLQSNFGGGYAAPSVPVGPSGASAGVATTALRSDAKLVIDLTANFTWTGIHNFGNGATPGQSNARLAVRNSNGNQIEFGHNNTSGYGGTLGANSGTGANFVALHAEAGTGSNTFRTRGIIGNVITTNAAGQLIIGRATNSNADNQALTTDITIDGNSFSTVRPILTADGTVGAPSHSFTSDPDCGMWRIGTNNIGLVVNGVTLLDIGTSYVATNTRMLSGDGSVGSPSLGFNSDSDTGWYRTATGDFSASSDNSRVARVFGAAAGGMQVADYGGTLQTVGYRNIPQNSQSANYTAVLADAGKHIFHPSGGGAGDVFTIPANASVAYDIGTAITFINRDSNSVSIQITTDTLVLAGTTSTGSRTLAQNGVATAIKVNATEWIISGTGLT